MVKFYNSLMFRLTTSFVLLIIVITGATYAYTYNQAKQALKDTIKEQLMQLSSIATAQLSDEQILYLASIQTGQDEEQEYAEIVSLLYNIRKNSQDISEFYVMKKEGEKVAFIADDWYISNKEEASLINDPYEDYDLKLLDAFKGNVTASDDFYTDEWGTWLTGYSPLKDQSGNTVAVLAVDMDVSVAQEKINFISSLIYYIIGIGIFSAFLIILFFSITIVKDLKALTKVANKISSGDINVDLPEIKSKNEIYYLGEGMKSMMAAITFLTDKIKK